MATRTLSFTLPAELAEKQALQSDHVSLEQIAVGWLFWGRGISEAGAQRPYHIAIPKPASTPGEE